MTDTIYTDVKIEKKKGDDENFQKVRGQFLQSLCDNLQQRFPSDFLVTATSLDPSSWPRNPLDRAFLARNMLQLCANCLA